MSVDNEQNIHLLLENQHVPVLDILLHSRSLQTHDLNKSRSINGEYYILFPVLKNYPNKFLEYTRMSIETFEYILSKISGLLIKNWCNLHVQPIIPEERFVLTLRFLATGSTYSHLAFSFKMGIKTVSSIILETMNVLWETLGPLHMPIPSSQDFLEISDDFYTKWGFPHCLGAVDGRHVAIKKPPKSGSLYYNYKKFFSIVLQAIVDANYKFIFIDVGGFGSQHDATTFRASQFYKALMQKKICLPRAGKVIDSNLHLPYFFIGDGAYPLSEFLMKPYSGTDLSQEKKIFNKRLSRARAVVENSFAQTSQKWRILYTTIDKSPEIVNLIIRCTCLLHNIIIDLQRKVNFHTSNAEEATFFDDDDEVMIAPVTGEDIRKELAIYFKDE